MQAVARASRSPTLRARSRSVSPRRQWNGELRRPSGGQLWKREDISDARGQSVPQNSLYSTAPQRSIIRDEGIGRSPNLRPEGPQEKWDKLMTFRTFVIDRVMEEADSNTAVLAYNKYKDEFKIHYISQMYKQLKDLPILAELYDPMHLIKLLEETRQRSRLAASDFMKLLTEERFLNLNLVEPLMEQYRSLNETIQSYRLFVGPDVESHIPLLPLSAPFFIPEDPDLNCLCLRNVPSHLSKGDFAEHLTNVGAQTGLIDLTLTFPETTTLNVNSAQEITRTVWLKYNTDEACNAAEIKLESTTLNRYACRPIRRVPDIARYTFRVTPAEAAHPARISRDLRLSARLILKLDDNMGISELLGAPVCEPEGEPLTEERCLRHPCLNELPNVLNDNGKKASEQLDLQLLYLRVTHCVCYYSGKRFATPRALWESVGPLYVRPKVEMADLLTLPGFSVANGVEEWDTSYVTATDLSDQIKSTTPINNNSAQTGDVSMNHHQEIVDPFENNKKYFMPPGFPEFEPLGLMTVPKDESATMDSSIIKSEMSATSDAQMVEIDEAPAAADAKPEIPIVKIEKNDNNILRGRSHPWLNVLDQRIVRLLQESFDYVIINENNEDVLTRWIEFCNANMTEVEADKWRCTICKKLFRGADFVHKHLKNKHNEFLTPIIDKVKEELTSKFYKNDPFHIPIPLPKPTPYLYRTAVLRQQKRHQSPLIGGQDLSSGLPPPLHLPSAYPTFMPTAGGIRLGRKEYKDWDAPKSGDQSNGNLRAAVQYDDL